MGFVEMNYDIHTLSLCEEYSEIRNSEADSQHD